MTGVEPMVIGNKQSQQISVTGLINRPVQGVMPATAAEIKPTHSGEQIIKSLTTVSWFHLADFQLFPHLLDDGRNLRDL